jgi:Ca-activated chloride channel family protein
VAVFAGQSIVQVPLTLDLQAVSLVLERADVEAVDRGGTDIGEGIRTALSSFPKENPDKRGRAILLITDGEITDGASDLEAACREAKEKGVPIVTVGIGTPQGRPVPAGPSFWGEAEYKRDAGGNVHVSKLDEKTLRRVADSTGGKFVQGESDEALSGINTVLSGLQKTQMKGKGTLRRQELAPGLGVAAAASLLLAAVL